MRPEGTTRRLWLVRHGLTAWNAEGRWQGSRDIPLSPEGLAQAQALGRRLRDVPLTAAFGSHLSRSRQTATLAVEGRLAVREEPLLAELSYGAWEGVTDAELRRRSPLEHGRWRSEPHAVRPGEGESLDELAARAREGLARCLSACSGDVLVVAHGGVNRVLLAGVLGAPLSRFWAFDQSPTCVNLLEIPEGDPADALRRARVLLMNCTSHLASG